jgi:hypothetical protein
MILVMKWMKTTLLFNKIICTLLLLLIPPLVWSQYLLIPMDESNQQNHLKSYGIAYWTIKNHTSIEWLLNYRGGSFLIPANDAIIRECRVRGVSFEPISAAQAAQIKAEISSPAVNMDVVKLEVVPKIAVYTPPGSQPWDDAVTLAMEYAEIPYDKIYDREILNGKLKDYNWIHLHHEDFTGQYGKFYAAYRNAPWYIRQKNELESLAKDLGFSKVSQLKLSVVLRLKEFVENGGYMFAMCSATDTYDITLAAAGLDICESMFDGDPAEPNYNSKLDFSKTLAFRNFTLSTNPYEYEYSDIDMTNFRRVKQEDDYFGLFEFSAKWDVIPTILTQNHTKVIKGFMGQTTAFNRKLIKPGIVILGENKQLNEVRYLYGIHGKGFFTFYGGHDPEDYQHRVGDKPTELDDHPNSPGYRLILNNILLPAAQKKKQKT